MGKHAARRIHDTMTLARKFGCALACCMYTPYHLAKCRTKKQRSPNAIFSAARMPVILAMRGQLPEINSSHSRCDTLMSKTDCHDQCKTQAPQIEYSAPLMFQATRRKSVTHYGPCTSQPRAPSPGKEKEHLATQNHDGKSKLSASSRLEPPGRAGCTGKEALHNTTMQTMRKATDL